MGFSRGHDPALAAAQPHTSNSYPTSNARISQKTLALPTLIHPAWIKSDHHASPEVRPTGQDTPVPPMPQYPFGTLNKYCWW
jgi:hypothetical protein